jgi:hypothetical protein
MSKLTILTAMAVAMTLFASPAMADPNIDMSSVVTSGTFNTNISSTSTAGAAIQGVKAGEISVDVGASNWATGLGGFVVGVDSDTDNAGAGVGGFADGGIAIGMVTLTGGSGFADTTGIATDISTAVVSFGTATVGFEGTFDVKMKTDDWN